MKVLPFDKNWILQQTLPMSGVANSDAAATHFN
jgi:hypothetical protein